MISILKEFTLSERENNIKIIFKNLSQNVNSTQEAKIEFMYQYKT